MVQFSTFENALEIAERVRYIFRINCIFKYQRFERVKLELLSETNKIAHLVETAYTDDKFPGLQFRLLKGEHDSWHSLGATEKVLFDFVPAVNFVNIQSPLPR